LIYNDSLVAQLAERLPTGRQGWLLTMEEWFVYYLRGLRDNNLYNRKPLVLIYKESCNSLKEAKQKEKYYKSGIGREFLKNLIPW
jgi:hypothetical protein